MISILKSVVKGLFYVLFFPIGLLAILLYAIFGIFVFIYRLIKLTILFFTGRNLTNELPEDEEVKKILESNNSKEEKATENVFNVYPSDNDMYKTNEYVSPTFDNKKEDEPSLLEEGEKDE